MTKADMRKFSMSEPGVLFKGPDMENFSIRRDSIHFERLELAVRHAVENLTGDEKYGAFIRIGNEDIRFPEIDDLYRNLKPEL
ncbi:hypothetical protein [Undibacter mobilis]|uniref:Uncharacterized protein n=1 Tax=Undibacter mobilis TaxID=2292256 RepID=A0A371B407_9BRAD|nr:hypothetical protein [Undibacter mobilis]RDV02264.1 hypothetical protein DXH78_16880 [Undibacter mobilis]